MAEQSQTLGSRENFWDHTSDEYSTSESGGESQADRSKTGYIARSILYQAYGAKICCPECWHQYERGEELADPEEYVPSTLLTTDEDGEAVQLYQRARPYRHCPNCGLVAEHGILLERPLQQFMQIVEEVLEIVEVPPSTAENILDRAHRRKQTNVSDRANLTRVVTEIEYGVQD